MGSKEDQLVPYGRDRSVSSSPRRGAKVQRYPDDRSRSRSRKRSRSKSGARLPTIRGERLRLAQEKITQKKFAKEQAAARVEAAAKAIEAAQKSWEAAIAADLEATNALQEVQSEFGKAEQEDRIQRVVDERQDARQAKDYDMADKLRTELRGMGVEVNDQDFSWTGPGGLSGQYTRYVPLGPKRDKPPPKKGGDRGGGGGGGGRGRRSPSYGGRPERRGGGGGRPARRGKYSDSYSCSASRSPPRRGRY